MTKFEYHMFLTITEVALSRYSQTKYSTFKAYHRGMYSSLSNGSLSSKEYQDIGLICEYVYKVFSISANNMGVYIFNYFSLDYSIIESFEKIVAIRKSLFPFKE